MTTAVFQQVINKYQHNPTIKAQFIYQDSKTQLLFCFGTFDSFIAGLVWCDCTYTYCILSVQCTHQLELFQ